jgi:hypothetical protein
MYDFEDTEIHPENDRRIKRMQPALAGNPDNRFMLYHACRSDTMVVYDVYTVFMGLNSSYVIPRYFQEDFAELPDKLAVLQRYRQQGFTDRDEIIRKVLVSCLGTPPSKNTDELALRHVREGYGIDSSSSRLRDAWGRAFPGLDESTVASQVSQIVKFAKKNGMRMGEDADQGHVVTFACTPEAKEMLVYRSEAYGHPSENGRQYRLVANPQYLKNAALVRSSVVSYHPYNRPKLLAFIYNLCEENRLQLSGGALPKKPRYRNSSAGSGMLYRWTR